MVGSVTNFLSPGDEVLVINGGKFGERWTKICQAYGMKVEELIVEWGYAVKAEQVEAALKKNPKIKAVFVQANETSTGVYHDVKSVAAVVKKTDALFVVDAISALVAHDIRTDEWGIDVDDRRFAEGCNAAARARLRLRQRQGLEDGGHRQDAQVLLQLQERAGEPGQEPDQLHLGRNAHHRPERVLQDAAGRRARQRVRAPRAPGQGNPRRGAAALGLKLFPKESPSNALTAIEAPAGVDGQAIYKDLREKYGITGAGGQDKLKGKIFRIAHLGYADTFDVITAIAGLEMVLKGLGHPVKLGTGVGAAQEILMK